MCTGEMETSVRIYVDTSLFVRIDLESVVHIKMDAIFHISIHLETCVHIETQPQFANVEQISN